MHQSCSDYEIPLFVVDVEFTLLIYASHFHFLLPVKAGIPNIFITDK